MGTAAGGVQGDRGGGTRGSCWRRARKRGLGPHRGGEQQRGAAARQNTAPGGQTDRKRRMCTALLGPSLQPIAGDPPGWERGTCSQSRGGGSGDTQTSPRQSHQPLPPPRHERTQPLVREAAQRWGVWQELCFPSFSCAAPSLPSCIPVPRGQQPRMHSHAGLCPPLCGTAGGACQVEFKRLASKSCVFQRHARLALYRPAWYHGRERDWG